MLSSSSDQPGLTLLSCLGDAPDKAFSLESLYDSQLCSSNHRQESEQYGDFICLSIGLRKGPLSWECPQRSGGTPLVWPRGKVSKSLEVQEWHATLGVAGGLRSLPLPFSTFTILNFLTLLLIFFFKKAVSLFMLFICKLPRVP